MTTAETISSSIFSDVTTSIAASTSKFTDDFDDATTITEATVLEDDLRSSSVAYHETESSTALVVEIANMTLKALSDNHDSSQKIDLQVSKINKLINFPDTENRFFRSLRTS